MSDIYVSVRWVSARWSANVALDTALKGLVKVPLSIYELALSVPLALSRSPRLPADQIF